MKNALLLGCATTSYMTHQKGIDSFTQTHYTIGGGPLITALESDGWTVTHIPSPRIGSDLPLTVAELRAYDAIIISDVGSNTFLLSPATTSAQRDIDRLQLIADYVRDGGGLLMIGGYFAFSGVNAKARYGATNIAPVLPVDILDTDDRVETPGGVRGIVSSEHDLATELPDGEWPILLGYNKTTPKPNATVIATIDGDPLIAVTQAEGGKVAVFTSDFAPHWAPAEFTEWPGYPSVWAGILSWLSAREQPMRRRESDDQPGEH